LQVPWLSALDKVFLLPIYPAREQPIPGINSELLLDKIQNGDKKLIVLGDLISELDRAQPEVLLMLGAGDFDQFLPQIVDFFSTKSLKL
jgi:UDP-N-acetylmuramate--alanine ligase